MDTRNVFRLLLACLSLLPAGPAVAQQSTTPAQIVIGQRHTLQSKVLGEERTYWVYLPISYERQPTRSYAVLYLLDGIAHFHVVTGIVHHLSSSTSAVQRIPELIVVAIPNTRRSRDFTPTSVKEGPYSESSGGADRFLLFLQEELFQAIESHYRALPERTLVGHSLGGLFTLHALEKSSDLFQSYIALDPSLWWDDQVLGKRLAAFDPGRLKRTTSVYIALAGVQDQKAEDKRRHDEAIIRFAEALRGKPASPLRARQRTFENETHLSVPLIGVYEGLLFTFDGYRKAP